MTTEIEAQAISLKVGDKFKLLGKTTIHTVKAVHSIKLFLVSKDLVVVVDEFFDEMLFRSLDFVTIIKNN